jgi:uncharacterized protein YndB with AHSA1/START domain
MSVSGTNSERACLVIADISGYTQYLQGVELDHAQDVIADLITALVTPLQSHFQLNKLEGDAAFLYSPAEDMDGSVLLDMIEGSYFAFRRRVRSIESATTCRCGACSLIPRLDLKILIHQGTVAHQRMLGMDELVGADVILIHRLLKNDVEEATGTKAYALFTGAAIRATGLEPELLDMVSFEAELSDVGKESGWVYDLDKAWRKEQARRRIYVAPEESVFTTEQFISNVAPGLVWEWMTRPERRTRYEVGFDSVVQVGNSARRGVGTETHCVHGEDTVKEEVLDWRPPRYVTYRGTFAGGEPFVLTDELIDEEGGVTVRKNFKAASAEHREAVVGVLGEMRPLISQWLPALADLLADDLADQPVVPAVELPRPDEAARLATTMRPPD